MSYARELAAWFPRWAARKPRHYRMGWCRKCRRSYRLPLSADPKAPALAQCDRCFAVELEKLAAELDRDTSRTPDEEGS